MSPIVPVNLSDFYNFYNRLLSNVIAEPQMVDENSVISLRKMYLDLVDNSGAVYLYPNELFAYTLLLCAKMGSEIKEKIISVQAIKGDSAPFDYSMCVSLMSVFLEPEEIGSGRLIYKDSFLNRFLIRPYDPTETVMELDTPLKLRSGVLSLNMGERFPLEQAGCLCTEYYDESDEMQVNFRDETHKLIRIFTFLEASDEKGIIFLKGEEGIGRTFALRKMAETMDRAVLSVDARKLMCYEDSSLDEMLRKIVSKCLFEDYVLSLKLPPNKEINLQRLQYVISVLQKDIGVLCICSSENVLDMISIDGTVNCVEFGRLSESDQKEYWKYFAEELGVKFDEDVELSDLVSIFNLSPEKIKKAIICARNASERIEENVRVSYDELKKQIRYLCVARFEQLATKLQSSFTWEDIELSENSKSKLLEAVNRIKYKSVVNDDFGFGKKLPYGRGLVIALYGPPGTGKTMVANVMANDLGMDIYRIDLSQISSKYIGESEKNLSSVFEAARYSNAILFFDEADALFSKRTDVSNSNDKYANSQTAFLLQKMEEYPGISILATNAIQSFDAAFKRRITYIVPIENPTYEMRLKLWEKVFPPETPLDDSVKFETYAQNVEIPGSAIKSAALAAAYRAAAKNSKVSHVDLCETIDEEYKKTGHISVLNDLLSG